LKKNINGYTAWIISSHYGALKHIGLRTSEKYSLFNGPLECKYVMFEMYEGSKKAEKVNSDKKGPEIQPDSEKKQYSMRPRKRKSE
jgi:hypothetical protein